MLWSKLGKNFTVLKLRPDQNSDQSAKLILFVAFGSDPKWPTRCFSLRTLSFFSNDSLTGWSHKTSTTIIPIRNLWVKLPFNCSQFIVVSSVIQVHAPALQVVKTFLWAFLPQRVMPDSLSVQPGLQGFVHLKREETFNLPMLSSYSDDDRLSCIRSFFVQNGETCLRFSAPGFALKLGHHPGLLSCWPVDSSKISIFVGSHWTWKRSTGLCGTPE